jgi:hypothetical protein
MDRGVWSSTNVRPRIVFDWMCFFDSVLLNLFDQLLFESVAYR